LLYGNAHGNSGRNKLLYHFFGFGKKVTRKAQLKGDYNAKGQGLSSHHALHGYEKVI
jgi:hypothetical protein